MTNPEMMKNLVEAQLKYYNERNLDSFCARFHPEIETFEIGSDVKKVGIESFRAAFKNLFESSPNLHCDLKSRIYLSEAVIDEEFVTGSIKHPDGIHAVAIYRFRDNLISSICFVR